LHNPRSSKSHSKASTANSITGGRVSRTCKKRPSIGGIGGSSGKRTVHQPTFHLLHQRYSSSRPCTELARPSIISLNLPSLTSSSFSVSNLIGKGFRHQSLLLPLIRVHRSVRKSPYHPPPSSSSPHTPPQITVPFINRLLR